MARKENHRKPNYFCLRKMNSPHAEGWAASHRELGDQSLGKREEKVIPCLGGGAKPWREGKHTTHVGKGRGGGLA